MNFTCRKASNYVSKMRGRSLRETDYKSRKDDKSLDLSRDLDINLMVLIAFYPVWDVIESR